MAVSGVYEVLLKQYELDFRQRLPPAILYRMLQEAAEHNAVDLGFDTAKLIEQHLTWMLMRLQVRIDAYPEGRQLLEVETWPAGVESRFAHRDFIARGSGSATPFAVASSAWFLIDTQRGRPVIVANHVTRNVAANRPRMVAEPFPEITPGPGPAHLREFPVRLSDIDLNGHVNNMHYAAWIAESVPESEWRANEIAALDIEYKRQIKYGDVVIVESTVTAPATYTHILRGRTDGLPAAIARTVWRPIAAASLQS